MTSTSNIPSSLRLVLASDLDHTMVEHHEPTHARLLAFNHAWSTQLAADSLLVFSTGRSPLLYAKLWEEAPMLSPGVLICSVGSEVFWYSPEKGFAPDPSWVAALDQDWDREGVLKVAGQFAERLKPQAASEQRRHKLSYLLQPAAGEGSAAGQTSEQVLDALRAALKDAGLAAKVIYSGGVDVDILATGAGKGRALEFVLRELKQAGKVPKQGVLVSGDSGNDIELLSVAGVRGCVVSNAHTELRAWAEGAQKAGGEQHHELFMATQPCAGGILEALQHYQLVQPTSANSHHGRNTTANGLAVSQVTATDEAAARVFAWDVAEALMVQRASQPGTAGFRMASSQLSLLLKHGTSFSTAADSETLQSSGDLSSKPAGALPNPPAASSGHADASASGGAQADTGSTASPSVSSWADLLQVSAVEGGATGAYRINFVAQRLTPEGTREVKDIRPVELLLEAVAPSSNQLAKHAFVASKAVDYRLTGRYPTLVKEVEV